MREMRSRMRLSSSSGRPREVACHAMRLRMPSSRWQCPSPRCRYARGRAGTWRRSSPGSLPHQVDGRHAHVFQPDFVDVAATVQRPDRTHADAGRSHVQQQHGNAALGARRDRCGPGRTCGRRIAPAWSGLLAVDHVLAAVALGAGRQRGQVRTRTRLRITLAPPVLHADDARQQLGCCAALPYFISTGPIMDRPKGSSLGAPALKHSTSKISRCSAFQPVPPCSTGQVGAPQPRSARTRCQRT